MLARASSDAGARLRRSKSTSTVHRHTPSIVESLDPEVARQYALAAATAAFTRSQAEESIERRTTRNSELSRSKSTASRKSLKSQGSHFPPRELNIRSVPPPKTGQSTISHRFSQPPMTNTGKFPLFDPTSSSERSSTSAQPLSAQPSVAFNEYGRPSSQPKSHRQSTTASITSQQIRKARSMYYASSVQTGSPIARPPAKYLATPPPPVSVSPATSAVPTTYVPSRSLGPSPLAIPRVPVAMAPGDTIDKARDKCLQDFQQRSIKHKPSLFLAPFKKRQDKPKDKTKEVASGVVSVPSTAYQAADESVADITSKDFMPQPDAKDRRSFSGSLKRKIKRVFRRTSNKSTSLPVQHIEASRDYFGLSNITPPHTNEHTEILGLDKALLQRMRSRTPSLDRGRPRIVGSGSRSSSNGSARSNRSLHSEANNSHASASRVTSWESSASGETLTQRAIKRLTVIHESKDSISSITDRTTSTLTKKKSLPLPSFSAFRDPMRMESLAEETSTPPLDPKRMFSALMREIDASKSTEASIHPADCTPGAESDVFESSKTRGLHFTGRDLHSSASRDFGHSGDTDQRLSVRRPASVAAYSVQSKKSSIKSFGRAIKTTIRTVTPGEQRTSPCPDQPFKAQEDANTPSSDASSRSQSDKESRTAIFRGLRLAKRKSGLIAQEDTVKGCAPSAEQIETRVAKAKSRWQTPLEDDATPQFPRETDRLYTVVNRVQQQSSHGTDVPFKSPVSPILSTAQLSKPMQTPLSPSVYSRNTDGVSILPNDSVMSFNSPYEHERTHDGGSAVILTSQSVRSYVIGTPSPNRPSSTRSSRDWKAWLSHEVSGIETTSQEDLTIHEQYATPSGQHRRDLAQTIHTTHTGSEDTTVIVRESIEKSTPQVKDEKLTMSATAQQTINPITPEAHLSRTAPEPITRLEGMAHYKEKSSQASPGPTPPWLKPEQKQKPSVPPNSRALGKKECGIPSPSRSSSASQPLPETPKSARMNDRFPFLTTGKRSSSNTSRLSHHSKSPTDSVGSSSKSATTTPGPKVYSDISAPATRSTTRHVPDTVVRRTEVLQKSKENVTPLSMGGPRKPNISPLGLVTRPKSMQPISSAALNRSSTDVNALKRESSPAEPRPRIRATIRPLAPEKLSRRPRSAFDLRGTPSPKPASEPRRPAMHLKMSSTSLARSKEPSTGPGASFDGEIGTEERDGCATPGQRMAERFLKERKSATVLERGVTKSASKFVREDTPAFL